MLATAFFLVFGTYVQFIQLRRLIKTVSFRPLFRAKEIRILLSSGIFVWLQALGSVIFGQFDRILLGISMGATVVASYSLCVQFAHPIFGLTASGLHFVFPYLSGRVGTISRVALKQTLAKIFFCNLLLVVCGAGLLLLFGNHLIRIWAGLVVAHSTARIFPMIILSSALMGLSVSGTYAMQAFGHFRTVALIGLGGRAAMLLLMIYLLHHIGLQGLATTRVCYGAIGLLVYLPLLRQLIIQKRTAPSFCLVAPYEFQEGSKP
jgi:O-antigen/teichoic acid export membrane protein